MPFWVFGANIAYFIPPNGWECIVAQKPDPCVQIAFVGKGETNFRPSLNLAIEEIDVSLKEYLKDVREIHETEMNVQWRDLGPFTFGSGKGRLTEITSSSAIGDVKMLQAILVQDGCAYILTGAVLKKEFLAMQKTLLSAIRSLTIVPDLFSAISNPSQRSRLTELFCAFDQKALPEERQTQWSRLQKVILDDFASMGAYWQILILKEGYQRIFSD
jgi:hypothetical protein